MRWQSRLGYYLQLGAACGWTSIHWLHRLRQPTLIMAGRDDPLVPLANAKLMHLLIPHSELQVFDCGHMFLMTRGEAIGARDQRVSRSTLSGAAAPSSSKQGDNMASSRMSPADLGAHLGEEIGVVVVDHRRPAPHQ